MVKSDPKTVIIVQARMTSTRLPGKVLKEVLGKPLLQYQIERLQRIPAADQIVIATTVNETDQPIVDLCDRLGVPVHRGSEQDVLARYYEAATQFQAEAIVRVTSDCPFIDPGVTQQVIAYYQQHRPQYDYVANFSLDRRTYPRGLDTEVFSYQALQESHQQATAAEQREHVTPFIYQHPEHYAIAALHDCDKPLAADYSHHRWTVDTPEDFELIRRMLTELMLMNPEFSWKDSLQLLDQFPDWQQINACIEQKSLRNRTLTEYKINEVRR
ncbi:MAG: glycosyltransferase family protein [Synechococcales bacterium]|nr:glycosyltransferase family protein [Synechococcales bacterium]